MATGISPLPVTPWLPSLSTARIAAPTRPTEPESLSPPRPSAAVRPCVRPVRAWRAHARRARPGALPHLLSPH
eukprot:6202491-Pleurochrysis_carterae.AAC.4